jgi:hypothetical protein
MIRYSYKIQNSKKKKKKHANAAAQQLSSLKKQCEVKLLSELLQAWNTSIALIKKIIEREPPPSLSIKLTSGSAITTHTVQ